VVTGRVRVARPVAAMLWLLSLAACTSHDSETLPAANPLLHRAAAAMRDVRTGRFDLEVKGELGGVEVRRAEGVMSRDGRASGTVDLEEGGQLVEFDVVFVNGTVYVKGPTGPFQSVPSELAGTIYDPTDLLIPSRGLARLLETARRARTVSRTDLDGTGSLEVETTLDGNVLAPLVPNPVPRAVRAMLWVGADEPRLLQVQTSIPGSGRATTELTLTVSDFNVPVRITPPPTS
jgi:lipoprotein LprG